MYKSIYWHTYIFIYTYTKRNKDVCLWINARKNIVNIKALYCIFVFSSFPWHINFKSYGDCDDCKDDNVDLNGSSFAPLGNFLFIIIATGAGVKSPHLTFIYLYMAVAIDSLQNEQILSNNRDGSNFHRDTHSFESCFDQLQTD